MENTFFEAPEYPFLEKLRNSLILFVKYSIALLATIFFIKILEYGYILIKGQMPSGFLMIIIKSFFYDLIFFFKSLPIMYLFFVLFFFSFRIKDNIFFSTVILFGIYILIYLLLIKYFFTALVPLGADLYGYSINDIKQTVIAGTSIDLFTFLIIILPFIFLWFALKMALKASFVKFSTAITVAVLALGLLYSDVSAVPTANGFKSDYAYNIAINKQAYFFEHSYAYFFDDEPEVDIYASNYFDDESEANSSLVSFKYVDNNKYPFLRENNTEDVLGNFFKIDSTQKPNIVFIQVEGLGRAFSGPNAYLGSFTPFLDQLITRSIYFENFLASQGRTFASLPSILGSLPFFNKGYNDLGNDMPNAITALSLLKYNGYQTTFLMSTNADFDNEGIFINKQNVNRLITKADFKEFPISNSSFWGYPDMDLMKKTIDYYSKLQNGPFMAYLQTISMHTPYKVPNIDRYYDLFEKQMNKLGFDDQQKNEHRTYKDQYACIMYADEAINYLISEFIKLPTYKNTIFIITGDHRLPEIPISTKIDRYHVPLIIFSPLLKRSSKIKSISSHLDITPSLTQFLKVNYKIKVPNLVTWVGSGLDTVKQFRNIHKYPLKQTINDLSDYVSGEYFLNGNTLFNIRDNMNIEPTQDDNKLNQLKSEFSQYKAKNQRLVESRKLMPDSLYRKYKP